MRYDAFISYRHSDLDMFIAKRIHKGFETFKVPRAVAKKTGKKKIQRVFRDQEELPIGSDLGDNIEGALRESEFLLVICSPRTPESYWVQKEISTFIEMHGREHVLAILVEGEPDESFPQQLLVDEKGNPVEPLAADVRGANKAERNKKLKTEIMRLAAPILGCSYDDLRQRHRERRMRKMMALASGVAVFAVAFGLYSAYNTAMIQKNYEEKQVNQSKYLADTSLNILETGDRETAALVAMEALPSEENDRPYVADAQYALSEALCTYKVGNRIGYDGLYEHDLPVRGISFNADKTQVLSYDQGKYVYVWDLETNELVTKIAPERDENGYIRTISDARIVADGNVVISDADTIRSVALDGTINWRIEHEKTNNFTTFSNDLEIVACEEENAIVFYSTRTGEIVGRMYNETEDPFTSEGAFNATNTKFAAAHYIDESGRLGCVTVYDFATGSTKSYQTSRNYIMEIAFTENDDLIVSFADGDEISFISNKDEAEAIIEKIDAISGETVWHDTYMVKILAMDAASTIMKTRSYTDDLGEIHNEVILTVDNCAHTWDSETGEKLVDEKIANAIYDLWVRADNSFAFLADSEGTIHIFNMTNGQNYTSSAVVTDYAIRDILVGNGYIVLRNYESPNLVVMKYHEGYGKEEVIDFDEIDSKVSLISEIRTSPEETYYVISAFGSGYKFFFCKTEDNSMIGQLELEDGYVENWKFVDDETIVVIDSNGEFHYYNMKDGTEEKKKYTDGSLKTYLTEENNFALLCNYDAYTIIDLEKREILSSIEKDDYVHSAILTEDGSTIYANIKEAGIVKIDVATEKVTELDKEKYFIASSSQVEDVMTVSKDNTRLAISCLDNTLRILDTETLECVEEIPFAGIDYCYLHFSDDNSEIMMQGDDYYFKIYDFEKQDYSFYGEHQNNHIQKIWFDETDNNIVVNTENELVILDADSYGMKAEIEDCPAYFSKHKRIYVEYYETVYQFPYMTLDMLYEEMERQFGDAKLTTQQEIKYNVN